MPTRSEDARATSHTSPGGPRLARIVDDPPARSGPPGLGSLPTSVPSSIRFARSGRAPPPYRSPSWRRERSSAIPGRGEHRWLGHLRIGRRVTLARVPAGIPEDGLLGWRTGAARTASACSNDGSNRVATTVGGTYTAGGVCGSEPTLPG